LHAPTYRLGQVDRRAHEADLAGGHAGDIEEVVDEPTEPAGLMPDRFPGSPRCVFLTARCVENPHGVADDVERVA
jgi:hypothetical protein